MPAPSPTQATAPHTPTPWTVEPDHLPSGQKMTYIAFRGVPIAKALDNCDSVEETLANAAFIVKAVNCHDDLVAALTDAVQELQKLRHYVTGKLAETSYEVSNRGRAAIAKAGA